jgi:tetratricopeptide (TPR) repeat protein
VLTLAGRHDEAIALEQAHLLALREYLQPDHWRIGSRLGAVGTSYLEAGRPADAETVLLESIAVYESSLGPEHSWTLRARARAGKALMALDRHAEAESMLRPAYLIALEGEAKPDRVKAREELRVLLEELHRGQGDHAAARRYRADAGAAKAAGSGVLPAGTQEGEAEH